MGRTPRASIIPIVSEGMVRVLDNINKEIDEKSNPLSAVIRGEDDMWDVSLMKFIYEMTTSSFSQNVLEMESRGLLKVDAEGVPMEARLRIEGMFGRLYRGEIMPAELKEELDRWGLFEAYQDRFLALFRR